MLVNQAVTQALGPTEPAANGPVVPTPLLSTTGGMRWAAKVVHTSWGASLAEGGVCDPCGAFTV